MVFGSAGGALFKAVSSALARPRVRFDESRRVSPNASRLRGFAVSLAPLLLLCAACSPASYAVRQRAAERALAGAESTEAVSEKAPYELWLSRLYLTKAREEAGQAHYALARELLATSHQNAVLARQLSLSRPTTGSRDSSKLDDRVDAARLAHEQGSARVREAAQ